MDRLDVGRKLEEFRRRRMLTQGELAGQAEVSPTTISGIESGKVSRPQVATLRKLAYILEVVPEEFFPGSYGVLSLEWAQGTSFENFEREVEAASLENLKALYGELEQEHRRLRWLYGELEPGSRQRPHVRHRIREVAARSASVSLIIEFHRSG
jgi:transcriptional regulator with XRE-family HTH domain